MWRSPLDPFWQRNKFIAMINLISNYSTDLTETDKASAGCCLRVIGDISNPILFLASINETFKPKLIQLPLAPARLKLGRMGFVPEWYNTEFDSKVMSRLHAEIWGDNEGRVWIQDTRSYHGTWLNGKRLSPQKEESRAYEIKTGDLLEMGINIFSNEVDVERTVVCRKVEAWVVFAGYHKPSGYHNPSGAQSTESDSKKITQIF